MQRGERAGSGPLKGSLPLSIDRSKGRSDPFDGEKPSRSRGPSFRKRYLFHLPSRSEGKIAMMWRKGIDWKRRGMRRCSNRRNEARRDVDEAQRAQGRRERNVAPKSVAWERLNCCRSAWNGAKTKEARARPRMQTAWTTAVWTVGRASPKIEADCHYGRRC